jgi:hypothetical protein
MSRIVPDSVHLRVTKQDNQMLWTAATCRRFESADKSAHSKFVACDFHAMTMAFSRLGEGSSKCKSPVRGGRKILWPSARIFRPQRDFMWWPSQAPSVKTLGYCQNSAGLCRWPPLPTTPGVKWAFDTNFTNFRQFKVAERRKKIAHGASRG